MSDVEEIKNEAVDTADDANIEKGKVTDAIKDGAGKVKDTVKGALDADGDGKIELEDIKDRAGQVGGKIKDGAGALGGKLKDGFGKIGGAFGKKEE